MTTVQNKSTTQSCDNATLSIKQVLTPAEELEKKQAFNAGWQTKTLEQKLSCYGVVKLKVLATRKNVNVENLRKVDIVSKMLPFVEEKDLPIKV